MSLTPYVMVSSADWGLAPTKTTRNDAAIKERLGHEYAELEERCRLAVYSFVSRCFDDTAGATRHYYEAPTQRYDELDSGNFLIALNYITMFDRYSDDRMLEMAERSYLWAYKNCVDAHPMFTWQGGVRDGFFPHELYVKYTADAFLTALALRARRPRPEYDTQILQYHNFLKRARQAGFAFTFNKNTYQWTDFGFSWNGFGGPVLAYLQAAESLGEPRYFEEARLWAEYGLSRQQDDGGFYLLDREFWNSDLTALELRSLVHMYEATQEKPYLEAARGYADWLVTQQRPNGSWPIGIDIDGEVCAPNVGPGDMPNIAMSLLRLHMVTGEQRYLDTAVLAVRYAISQQLAEPDQPYYDDPNARWGFWSWDPGFDYTLSGDQIVHHVRGIMAVADFLGAQHRE